MAKETPKAINSHMESKISSMKQGQSKDMAKGPRKLAAGEVENTSPKVAKVK